MSFHRPAAEERAARSDAEWVRLLSLHLPNAARATRHLDAERRAEPLCRSVLDALQIPVFGLGAGDRLRLVNKSGVALIRARRWVSGDGGVLGASSTMLTPHILTDALNRLRKGLSSTVLLTEGSTRRQAVATAMPFAGAPRNASAQLISGFVWILPCHAESGSARSLGRLFKLSRAEIALLDRLVHGAALSEAAAALYISIHTARTQLKSIFRKTGRRTQSQLLALANRMSMICMRDDG